MKLRLLVLSLALFGSPNCLIGQQISYVSENRFVASTFSSFTGPDTVTVVSADGFGDFEASLFEAGQSSFLNFDSLTATGSATGCCFFSMLAIDQGQSVFDVVFDLSDPTEFSLDIFLSDVEFGDVIITGPSLNISQSVEFFEPFQFSESGILDAGQYSVFIDIQNVGAANGGLATDFVSTFDLDFQIATIPEPSPWMPLGLGIALVASRRSRI